MTRCNDITCVNTNPTMEGLCDDCKQYCGRCIEDWYDYDTTSEEDLYHKGIKVLSDCEECGVCKNCEHFLECSKANN